MTPEQKAKIASYERTFKTRNLGTTLDGTVSLEFLCTDNAGFTHWMRLIVAPDGTSRHAR